MSTESDSATVNVTYSTRAEAQTAIRELNGKVVEESQLKVGGIKLLKINSCHNN